MGIISSFTKGLLIGQTALPDREWLNLNCEQVNLSDGDISAIIEYLRKSRFRFKLLVRAAIIFMISAGLAMLLFGEIISGVGFWFFVFCAMPAFIDVFKFLLRLLPGENNRISDMLQSKRFAAVYEVPVTHKKRRTKLVSRERSYHIYSEGKDPAGNGKAFKVFKVGEAEYKTVRKGQSAIAIAYSSIRVSIFDLRNL